MNSSVLAWWASSSDSSCFRRSSNSPRYELPATTAATSSAISRLPASLGVGVGGLGWGGWAGAGTWAAAEASFLVQKGATAGPAGWALKGAPGLTRVAPPRARR
jgi:hypothetical protein